MTPPNTKSIDAAAAAAGAAAAADAAPSADAERSKQKSRLESEWFNWRKACRVFFENFEAEAFYGK